MIHIIAAIAENGVIGKDNRIPWEIPADLAHFKSLTAGHTVIMGRKTFESFPNGALPGRRNIVITRQGDYNADGIEVANSLQAAIDTIIDTNEAFIIGGGEIYNQALPLCSRLYLTEIDSEIADADTFFPEINRDEWEIFEQSDIKQDPRSGVQFRFTCLSRK